MKKYSILMVVVLFLSACTSNTPQPNSMSDADKVATIVAGTLSAMTLQAPTEIPATPTPPEANNLNVNGQLQGRLAFIRKDNIWISIDGVENQLTNDATGRLDVWYSNPRISPDGTKVAYFKNLGYDSRTLVISDVDGKNIRQFSDVTWVEWSNDSQKIYYALSIDPVENMIVKSINLSTGELEEQGQFTVHSGCGGGSSDPADLISSYENLRTSTGGGYIFDLSSQNNHIIHALNCQGSGLGLLDLSTKQDWALNNDVKGSTISPDGSKVAAISGNSIVVFNISNGNMENSFPTPETPRILLWSDNNQEILYSTSRLANTLISEDGNQFKMNASTLWQISLKNGQNTKIIDIEAHDLKPIFTNGKKVLVVMVENAKELFDYISDGNRENINGHLPTSNIIEVDLATSSSNIALNDAQQSSYFK